MKAKTMQKKTVLRKILVSFAALCFLIAAPAAAQDNEDFSEGDLEKFAEAQSEVEDIRTEYSDELSGVEDSEKARELQDKYAQQMVDAIKEIGLDVKTYNEISVAIQNDPEFKEKVEGMSD